MYDVLCGIGYLYYYLYAFALFWTCVAALTHLVSTARAAGPQARQPYIVQGTWYIVQGAYGPSAYLYVV